MNETIEKPSWIGDAILLQLAAERGGRTGESHSEAPRVGGRHFTEVMATYYSRPRCFAIQSSPMYVYALLTAYGMVFPLKIFLDMHEI